MNGPFSRYCFSRLGVGILVLAFALTGATSSVAAPEDNFPPGGSFPVGWQTSPGADAGWAVASDSANGGAFSLKSAPITDDQFAAVQVTGNFAAGTISFAYRVSSEAGFDALQFYIDGVARFVDAPAGEIPWTQVSFPVTAGVHVFKWAYIKDGSTSEGADRAWIDTVVLPSGSLLEDDNFPPGGQTPAGWTTAPGANAGWVVATDSTNRGPHSLKSATIGDNQSAAIQFAGTFVAGNVSFAYQVSSETGFDFLQFYIDGVPQFSGDALAGEIPWTQASFPITAGAHTLKWAYAKDSSFSEGEDAAWIDTVVLPTGSANTTTAITQHTPNPSTVGAPIAVMANVTVTPPGSGTPTGTITVSDGSATCPITLPATTCNLTPTSAGMKTLTATYSGNANFNGSTSPGVPHTVDKASTSTTITAHTPNPSTVGTPIAVTANVAVTLPGTGTPTGTVTVSDGSASCLITLPATGCNLIPTSAGAKTLTATYTGDGNFNGSVSAGVGHTVTGVAAAPTLQSALSRRVHGAAGTFDLPLSLLPTNPATEPRLGPAATVVLTFDKAITGASVAVTEGTATAGAPSFSGNDVIVGLTGVADVQYVTISLTNVSAGDGGTGGSGSVRIGFLAGDVNGSRLVNSTDILTVKASSGATASALNFKSDLNASGLINSTDILTVKASSGHALPLP